MSDTNQGAMCNQAIMLITDGAHDKYEEIYRQYSWPEKKVRAPILYNPINRVYSDIYILQDDISGYYISDIYLLSPTSTDLGTCIYLSHWTRGQRQ